ncbi:hypothetical protein DUI87_03165 [Hirundo rustica rustica]|uniref:ribonuclease H n=1 Tax=Hirundo rustica rustica TaxID=333673 RepID=A0A3M0L3D3_HIRRU|nr:hypothetical protein DUI87_03165 [Hirundo rustica rustica]
MAVAEIVFLDDINTRNPDLVPCTPVMWRKLVRLGPQEYSSALAITKRDETEETVLDMAKKLRTYADAVHGPTHARIAALEMHMRKLEDKMEENHKELKQDILQISAVQVEARENRVFWTVWIRWPGTSEPQKYEALVDTGAQCTLLPSRHVGEESVSIAGVTGVSQDLTLVEADVSLTGNEWKRHPIVTGPEAPCILGIDFLRNGYFKDPKGFRWAFGIAAVETEGVKQLNTLPGLSENPSAVGLLKVEEQQVPIATSIVHRRQYRTTRDAVIPIHKMIRELESQGVVSKTHSPFNSPIWPVRKSDGGWRLTVDYRALNKVTPPLSAAVPDMLELQYELESKAAKWYATIDIANAFFSIPLAAECRPQFAFTWRGVQYTWNRLPQGWKHSPTICHGLIQAALEKGEAPEHLQYIDDIIVWGNTAMEVFEKGEKIIQILLKAGFAIKKSKVKGPAQEIQFLGIVSPLYLVTRKKNDFHWGREQKQAFAQIKQEIAHAVALGPVRTGPDVKNVLYSAAGNNGLSWSLWQKGPGETRGRPLGFWSRSYRGSEANYTPTEKEILAAYEGVQAASEVVGTETQLLLAPRLPVLGWMFKAEVSSTHHATNATWSKWIALITQRAHIGNPNRPGILEIITNWPEGENFGLMDEEEQEQVTRAEEAPPYNQLPAEETRYALFTDGSCRIIGMKRKWKAAVWSPTRQVAQATEGEGGSSQLAELKAVQLALDSAEREKWPKLYLYTDSWMVANALWGWLEKWKKANWQRRGKPIWAAYEWKDIATQVEKLPAKVCHVDAHVLKSRANEEHRNNEQVDQAAKIEVSKIDLDWQHKGELFLARWAHDASGHQGRDATYKWARDRGVDLTMDSISQVICDCETCAPIKQAKRVKPLWYGGRWSKYKYGEAWQIDYITLPQTRQGKCYVLTMVEATTGWLETYPVPHATARNTILGLEKQVLWRHNTPERIESDNGAPFKNSLINNWAREHGIDWVYHIPYHAPASGKVERYNGLLKTTLKALGGGSFKNWEQHLAKATWNHPEWQRDCGMRSPSDPLVLALEKDNKATKGKPKRCCSTCSINQRCTHPDKVYQAEALEQETEDILKPAPRRQERRRVVGDANSEPSLTPTPLTSSLASSFFGRTATKVGVSPPTPKPRDPPLPSSDSEWDEPEPLPPGPKIPSRGPIASRTRKQTREVVQAPLRQAITSDGETKLIKVPFSSIDLEIWERIAKGYRSDPIGVAKEMKFLIKQHSPDWADLQLLLDALTETEKQLVLKVAGNLAEDDCRTTQEDVKDVFPLQDPGWDPNDDEELGRLKRYQELIVKGLERAIPKTINWSALYAIK